MTSIHLTPEQEQVVHHPIGQHARVLAVAGSGKSTTMAHRIQHLVLERSCQALQHPGADVQRPGAQAVHCPPGQGRPAREPAACRAHLPHLQLPGHQPDGQERRHSPASTQFWLADKAELIWLTVKRAITNLEKSKAFPIEAVDPEEALMPSACGKARSSHPDGQAHTLHPYLPLVYPGVRAPAPGRVMP